MRLIWQNILWALIYNVVAIPSAVMGILVPWHAAVGMSVSSMIVVLNSLRILSKKDK
jgi:Cu2+-exporting ATPase